MNEYVVSVGTEKKNAIIEKESSVIIDGKKYDTELIQLSKYAYQIKINNKIYQATAEKKGSGEFYITVAGSSFQTIVRTNLEEKANEYMQNKAKEGGSAVVKSPMPGLIVKILKNIGDEVNVGEPLILLEAMKMENEIRAVTSGVVKQISTKENASVEKGEVLLEIG